MLGRQAYIAGLLVPPIAPQSPLSIIWGWNNRTVVAALPNGLSVTPLTSDQIQAGGETLRSEIHKLINSIWSK
jgi:hypothetical protein